MCRVKYNLLSDEYASLEKQVHDLPAVDAELSVGAKEHNDFANRIRQEKTRQVPYRQVNLIVG